MASPPPPFERLVRFEADGGEEMYGDLPGSSIDSDSIVGSTVEVLKGDFAAGFAKTGAKATVRKVSPPTPTIALMANR